MLISAPLSTKLDWKFAFERSEMLREFQSELLVSISHELRTPLSSQMGALQLILTDLCDSPEEEREYVAAAQHSVEQSLHLLEAFSDLARYQPPINPLQLKRIALRPILMTVYQLTVLQAKDQGIHYHWPILNQGPTADLETPSTPDDWDWVLSADPDALTQALLGLSRWTIKQLHFGTFTAQLNSTAVAEAIEFSFKITGNLSTSIDPDTSLAWRVSQRLINEMQGQLRLEQNQPTQLQVTLALMKCAA